MDIDLDLIIFEAEELLQRAERASMYPANELIKIAMMLKDLALAIKER